jgi:hypothetical protein
MKNTLFYITFLSLITSCNQTKTTIETTDTTIVTKIDTVATDSSISEVMYVEDILECVDLQGLEKKYGANSIIKKAIVETGEGSFETTKLFADTDKEVHIYWQDGKEFKQIQDVVVKGKLDENAKLKNTTPWVSKRGVQLGMRMSEVVALNGKTFTITGIGWDLGGNVVSWEGGKLANKNVNVRFNDYSDNMGGLKEADYNTIVGDREFDTKHPAIQKLNPTVDEFSVYKTFEITPELGQKMTKEVEKKQIKR